MEATYILIFTTGFLGGAHCIGMCGPIVASYTLQGASSANNGRSVFRKILPHLLYNMGRITTYMFIGALMGLTGSFVNNISGFQDIVAVIAGLIMIGMGVSITGLYGGTGWLEARGGLIIKVAREILLQKSQWKHFILGSLFGFLPCGLSYSVFMASAGTGNPVSGMLIALLFGLGTAPWLLMFGIAADLINARLRGLVYKIAGVVVILMGISFLIKGMKAYA